MDNADEWISQNKNLIDIMGKTEIVRIAFERGFAEGEISALKEANALVEAQIDKIAVQAE